MRQPRYLMLWLIVALVAAVCFAAGVWQWDRLHQKHSINAELRANDSHAMVDVAEVLPLADADGAAAQARAAEYRQVTATGTYDVTHQVLVRGQTVEGAVGFYVLTPLRMSDAAVLVVRGFLGAGENAKDTPSTPAPPPGPVTITARIVPASDSNEDFGKLPAGQVDAINPAQAATRIGAPVLAGYLLLEDDQPGTADLIAIPGPDMSNPAGGAIEPQHLAYVIQWFIFGLLALGLPFILARADRRQLDERTGGDHASAIDNPATTTNPATVQAKLADRYGR